MRSPAASVVTATDLPLPVHVRGKVRDVYEAGDALLIVATDRISAFDHVLPSPVPDKGRILCQLSAFWFERTRAVVPNHLITADVAQMPGDVRAHADLLRGRSMLVRRARRLDVECVVRGCLAGSGWQEYLRKGGVGGVRLPHGLREGAMLAEPIFSPATKASSGHDENIDFAEMTRRIGVDLAARLRHVSLALYDAARVHASACGLVLADTKFEFGLVPGALGEEVLLIDEALTPDSSRYWDAGAYAAGQLIQFDKQFVRDYLTAIGWNREPPAPSLPSDVIESTRQRYRETYRRLVGREIA